MLVGLKYLRAVMSQCWSIGKKTGLSFFGNLAEALIGEVFLTPGTICGIHDAIGISTRTWFPPWQMLAEVAI
jgi:hypothetical protein